jgi:hypothetical protein
LLKQVPTLAPRRDERRWRKEADLHERRLYALAEFDRMAEDWGLVTMQGGRPVPVELDSIYPHSLDYVAMSDATYEKVTGKKR